MEVNTKAVGIVNVEENQIVNFSDGLLGFEDFKSYALIDSEYEPFIWLQTLDKADLSFLLVDPFLIYQKYEADIDDSALKYIKITSPEDIIVMTIVTVPTDGSAITANFLGPIVINRKNNQCVQVVLNDSRWTTKFDIVAALKGKGEN